MYTSYQPSFNIVSSQHDNGADKHLYYPNDHFNHSAPNPEIYGFTERREAEGSEDFDVVNHDSSYGRDIKAVHGYPTFTSPPSRSINGSGKNVRFQATSAPTSPYSNHYPPQYQPQNRISYRRTDEVMLRVQSVLCDSANFIVCDFTL